MADEERDARVQAREDARAQAQELAGIRAQLEAAQLENVRLRRAAEVPLPQPPQEDLGAAARPPQPFAFPQKVTYPELTKLTRKAFETFRLEYGKAFRQASVQYLVPKAFQDCIEPTVAKQVMQLCGLTPLQIHEAGAEWLALTRQQIMDAVARKFFTLASAAELERYYATIAMGGYATCDEQLLAVQAFQQDLAALDANVQAAGAIPPATTTKVEIVLVTLRKTPQAEFLLKSKKFQTVDDIAHFWAGRIEERDRDRPGHAIDRTDPRVRKPVDIRPLRSVRERQRGRFKAGRCRVGPAPLPFDVRAGVPAK